MVKVYFNDERGGLDFKIECKITPGMELFEHQYFTEQYIILTRLKKNRRRTKLT